MNYKNILHFFLAFSLLLLSFNGFSANLKTIKESNEVILKLNSKEKNTVSELLFIEELEIEEENEKNSSVAVDLEDYSNLENKLQQRKFSNYKENNIRFSTKDLFILFHSWRFHLS